MNNNISNINNIKVNKIKNKASSVSPCSKNKPKNINDKICYKNINSKYLKDKINWNKLNKIHLQKELELLQHCTFKPNINTNFQFKDNPNNSDIPNKTIQERTLERMQYWEDKKVTKLELQKNVSRNKDIENCSFKPITNSSLPDFQGKYIKGLKNYLDRQIKSQQVQKEKKDKLNPNYNEMYDNLFKKKEKRIAEQNMNYKDYQNAINILHKELHKK